MPKVDSTNFHTTDQGFKVFAKSPDSNGILQDAVVDSASTKYGEGFGCASGYHGGDVIVETSYDPEVNVSQQIIVKFESGLKTVKGVLHSLYNSKSGYDAKTEKASISAYYNNEPIGQTIVFGKANGVALFSVDFGEVFDELIFEGMPVIGQTKLSDSSDFLIHSLTW
jgi:hypothetical protein